MKHRKNATGICRHPSHIKVALTLSKVPLIAYKDCLNGQLDIIGRNNSKVVFEFCTCPLPISICELTISPPPKSDLWPLWYSSRPEHGIL